MEQSNFSKYRGPILIGVITAIAIIVVFYLVSRPQKDVQVAQPSNVEVVEATSTPQPDITSSATSSPISPLSPLSPVTTSLEPSFRPEEIEALLQQGIVRYENRDYQGAIEIFDQVLDSNPNNFLAHNARGSIYSDLQDYDQALADYTKAIELEPFFPHAYYNRGRVYSFIKKYDEALTDLQESINLAPTEFGYRANGNIGLIYHQMGEYSKAIEAFEQSISLNTDNKADIYFYRGETYTALENYDAAIANYQSAVERFANYGLAYQSLGYAQYKRGATVSALENLQQAIQISPNSPAAHLYLALVYTAQNELDNADSEVSQAVDLLDTLSEDEQVFMLTRVLADFETLAQENSGQAAEIEAMINKLPPP